MTISFGDLRRGVALEIDGQPYEVVEYARQRMQQRAPVTRIKVRNLLSGAVSERSFPGSENTFKLADVETKPSQYLYTDGEFYNFMDLETYDQFPITKDKIADSLNYLKEEMSVEVVYYKGQVIAVKVPTFVELKVTNSPPGLKGDTAQGGTKPATLETGLTINVPLFISEGQVIKVDTRTGEYVERVA
jgi:elongation factor P